MTSNSLSTKQAKQRSILSHGIRHYWWAMVIALVGYGFAGPVLTLIQITNLQRNSYHREMEEGLLQLWYQWRISRFLEEDWLTVQVVGSILLAVVLGTLMFYYVHQKRQVQFYHSQPIHRSRLFCGFYLTGLLIQCVAMVAMLVLTLAIVSGYGYGEAIRLGVLLPRFFQVLLFVWAAYSLSVLAAMLTGTVMTQMGVNLILQLGVPAIAVLLDDTLELFLATYASGMEINGILTTMCYTSPLIGGLCVLAEDAFTGGMGNWTLRILLIQLVLSVGGTGVAWLLYRLRPSEAAGRSLVFPITEPILRAILVFTCALAGGILFMSMTQSKAFFYFALVAFAVLTFMACQVVIHRDFKAMIKGMPQCGVLLVLLVAFVGALQLDLVGYDSYLPAPEKVERVYLDVNHMSENRNTDGMVIANFGSADPAVKQQVYNLLKPVVEQKAYEASAFSRGSEEDAAVESAAVTEDTVAVVMETPGEQNVYVQVSYQLQNGKTVKRCYSMVPMELLRENFYQLYDCRSYRDSLYGEIMALQPENIYYMDLAETSFYRNRGKMSQVDLEALVPSERMLYSQQRQEMAEALLQAYQQDLAARTHEALEEPALYSLSVAARVQSGSQRHSQRAQQFGQDAGVTTWHYNLYITASDKNSIALLEQWQQQGQLKLWKNYYWSQVSIFQLSQPWGDAQLEALSEKLNSYKGEDWQSQVDAPLVASYEQQPQASQMAYMLDGGRHSCFIRQNPNQLAVVVHTPTSADDSYDYRIQLMTVMPE